MILAVFQKGVLTPEEFVAAGDLLVDKCPSWSWEAGDPAKVVFWPSLPGLPLLFCITMPAYVAFACDAN